MPIGATYASGHSHAHSFAHLAWSFVKAAYCATQLKELKQDATTADKAITVGFAGISREFKRIETEVKGKFDAQRTEGPFLAGDRLVAGHDWERNVHEAFMRFWEGSFLEVRF